MAKKGKDFPHYFLCCSTFPEGNLKLHKFPRPSLNQKDIINIHERMFVIKEKLQKVENVKQQIFHCQG